MADRETILHRVLRREQRLREIRRYHARMNECLYDMYTCSELARLAHLRQHRALVHRIVEELVLQHEMICRASLRRLEIGLEMVLRMVA
jgi:hypothetical protein